MFLIINCSILQRLSFFVKVFSNRIIQLLLSNSFTLEYQLLLLYKVFLNNYSLVLNVSFSNVFLKLVLFIINFSLLYHLYLLYDLSLLHHFYCWLWLISLTILRAVFHDCCLTWQTDSFCNYKWIKMDNICCNI